MKQRYKIHVCKDHLMFCSGHFISYEGSKCERLHGHNYRTAVEVEGPLDENHYVFDFIALKQVTKSIVDEIDHRVMLPMHNEHIKVEEHPKRVRATYKDREWIFPREDCALLPIKNTTAEMLAAYIGERLIEDLQRLYRYRPEIIRVEVEESMGQSGTCEITLEARD